jgi:N-acetyl-anhydromuramyl-L-alanine amidase AmpD
MTNAEKRFKELFEKVGETTLTTAEAQECLSCLWDYTLERIKALELGKYYPTVQRTPNRLTKVEDIWWVDHFTAGIASASTLNWFSSNKCKKSKDGKMKTAGASVHFVMDYTGDPYYIVKIPDGAWHEPHRNADSVAIEMVNPGGLTFDKATNKWRFWAREMPDELIRALPPVFLDKPYRGIKILQPFSKNQIVANIKLKRIVIAAFPGRFELCRMSQHSDWRAGKTDMGPLWPFADINAAAFSNDPIPELSFIQNYDPDFLDFVGTIADIDENNNPEYGAGTPTHDDDPDPEPKLMSTLEIQQALDRKGIAVKVDGKFGPKTQAAVKTFQMNWNKTHAATDQLKVDGIPGPKTCAALRAS